MIKAYQLVREQTCVILKITSAAASAADLSTCAGSFFSEESIVVLSELAREPFFLFLFRGVVWQQCISEDALKAGKKGSYPSMSVVDTLLYFFVASRTKTLARSSQLVRALCDRGAREGWLVTSYFIMIWLGNQRGLIGYLVFYYVLQFVRYVWSCCCSVEFSRVAVNASRLCVSPRVVM